MRTTIVMEQWESYRKRILFSVHGKKMADLQETCMASVPCRKTFSVWRCRNSWSRKNWIPSTFLRKNYASCFLMSHKYPTAPPIGPMYHGRLQTFMKWRPVRRQNHWDFLCVFPKLENSDISHVPVVPPNPQSLFAFQRGHFCGVYIVKVPFLARPKLVWAHCHIRSSCLLQGASKCHYLASKWSKAKAQTEGEYTWEASQFLLCCNCLLKNWQQRFEEHSNLVTMLGKKVTSRQFSGALFFFHFLWMEIRFCLKPHNLPPPPAHQGP